MFASYCASYALGAVKIISAHREAVVSVAAGTLVTGTVVTGRLVTGASVTGVDVTGA